MSIVGGTIQALLLSIRDDFGDAGTRALEEFFKPYRRQSELAGRSPNELRLNLHSIEGLRAVYRRLKAEKGAIERDRRKKETKEAIERNRLKKQPLPSNFQPKWFAAEDNQRMDIQQAWRGQLRRGQ